MGANDLIFNLRESGFSISANNSKLQIAPAKELTDELKQTIKQGKPEILCALHQEGELKRLVRLVADFHCFSQEDYEEAMTNALADPINALTCFTSLARQAGLMDKEIN